MENITFDSLPESIQELHKKLDILLSKASAPVDKDKLLTIDELIEYLPEHPARQTVYGWVNNRTIPYQKHGSRLYFLRSDIESWLAKGRQI